MKQQFEQMIDVLAEQRSLSVEQYEALIANCTPELAEYAAGLARQVACAVYGNAIYIRGLIELSNYCANNCYYCGIRRSNNTCERYRLTPEQALECADTGYELGFRTFVLQGGEDPYLTDEHLVPLVAALHAAHPDCAITLSLGERTPESYAALRGAGAERYLLRQEAASPELYSRIHPSELSHANRMECLHTLRELGYVVGCGFMVGVPHQTAAHLAADLKFIEEFAPGMCGIGPFVPHHATAYAAESAGSVELTCFLLSLLRLMHPTLLLPATTALGTLDAHGREKGVLAGANVVMPNLSPVDVREKYELYNNKACTGAESAEFVHELGERMASIGYDVLVDRGDPKGGAR